MEYTIRRGFLAKVLRRAVAGLLPRRPRQRRPRLVDRGAADRRRGRAALHHHGDHRGRHRPARGPPPPAQPVDRGPARGGGGQRAAGADLRAEVEGRTSALASSDGPIREQQDRAAASRADAGFTALAGTGVTVELDDAPRRNDGTLPAGATNDDLVVHQGDVQAVVNALWAGGAEAMSIMNVRVLSTSAVRCVGNTLLLHGRVYSPPFKIVAIGDPAALQQALADSQGVRLFRDLVDDYKLGYKETVSSVTVPAFEGSTTLRSATVPGEPRTGRPARGPRRPSPRPGRRADRLPAQGRPARARPGPPDPGRRLAGAHAPAPLPGSPSAPRARPGRRRRSRACRPLRRMVSRHARPDPPGTGARPSREPRPFPAERRPDPLRRQPRPAHRARPSRSGGPRPSLARQLRAARLRRLRPARPGRPRSPRPCRARPPRPCRARPPRPADPAAPVLPTSAARRPRLRPPGPPNPTGAGPASTGAARARPSFRRPVPRGPARDLGRPVPLPRHGPAMPRSRHSTSSRPADRRSRDRLAGPLTSTDVEAATSTGPDPAGFGRPGARRPSAGPADLRHASPTDPARPPGPVPAGQLPWPGAGPVRPASPTAPRVAVRAISGRRSPPGPPVPAATAPSARRSIGPPAREGRPAADAPTAFDPEGRARRPTARRPRSPRPARAATSIPGPPP